MFLYPCLGLVPREQELKGLSDGIYFRKFPRLENRLERGLGGRGVEGRGINLAAVAET